MTISHHHMPRRIPVHIHPSSAGYLLWFWFVSVRVLLSVPPTPVAFSFVRSFGLVTASIISSLARVRVALDTSQSYVCLFTVLIIINILLIHMECVHQEWTNASSSLNNKLCMKILLPIPLEPYLLAFNWLFTHWLTFPILMKCKSTGVHFHFSHLQFSTTTNDRCKDDNSNFLLRDSHTLHCCVSNEVHIYSPGSACFKWMCLLMANPTIDHKFPPSLQFRKTLYNTV